MVYAMTVAEITVKQDVIMAALIHARLRALLLAMAIAKMSVLVQQLEMFM